MEVVCVEVVGDFDGFGRRYKKAPLWLWNFFYDGFHLFGKSELQRFVKLVKNQLSNARRVKCFPLDVVFDSPGSSHQKCWRC